MKLSFLKPLAAGVLALGLTGAAQADINVGVVLSLTGPYASIGIPEQDTVLLWPKQIGSEKINLTILDDASDPTAATMAARKLISEQKIDFLAGSSSTPSSLAMLQVAAETQTPMIALAGGGAIVTPMDDLRKWAFKTPPSEAIQLRVAFKKMREEGIKRLGVAAVSSAFGQTFVDVLKEISEDEGIEITAIERFGGADTSFVSQALKLMASKPDAIFIAAPGTTAALPQLTLKQRGFDGPYFQTQAAANADFLRVGGKALEGTYMPVSPMLVPEQLPDSHPSKQEGIKYVQLYEAKHGANTRSLGGGVAWSTFILLDNAVQEVLKTEKPGTLAFRQALRDALENSKDIVTPEGVFNMSPEDHNGADERSQVLVKIEDGQWRYVD